MNPLTEHRLRMTRRQFFGQGAGVGVADLASLLSGAARAESGGTRAEPFG